MLSRVAVRSVAFAAGALALGAALRALPPTRAHDREGVTDGLAVASDDPRDDPHVSRKFLVLRTGCWTVTADAWFDPALGDYVGSAFADLPTVANFLLRREYGAPDAAVYLTGELDYDFASHLRSIVRACDVPGAKAIVYVNAPGVLASFTTPAATLAALPVLDRIERECPAAAADARTFREQLLRSTGHDVATRELGTRLGGAALPAREAGDAALEEARRIGARLRHYRGLSPWSDEPLPVARDLDAAVVDTLERCAATYGHPRTRSVRARLAPTLEEYWSVSGGDAAWQSWLRMVASYCASRHVAFVFYVPPHVHLGAAEYETAFKPAFLDRVAQVLAPFPEARLVDHALRPELGKDDLTWVHGERELVKLGYLVNAIGQLKRCRLLLDELARVDGGFARTGERAWAGEAALPPPDRDLAFVPRAESSEQIYQPEVARLSRPRP